MSFEDFDGDVPATWTLTEEVGANVLGICCRYQIASETYNIPLEEQTYAALDALVEGKPLAEAVALINPAHPFAYKVIEELGNVAQKLADEHYKARLRFLS